MLHLLHIPAFINTPVSISDQLIPYWTGFLFFFGLCVGSFLNVCIWRIPRDESIVFPPSHCPKCDHELAWYENIPLVSWLCLRGRCRKCSRPITIRYFLVELLTGLLFLGVWIRFLYFAQALKLGYFNFLGLVIGSLTITVLAILTAFIDCEHFLIPNKITYPTLIIGLLLALIFPDLWPWPENGGRWQALTMACASVTVCGGILFLLSFVGKKIFKKDALGLGDVKYIAAQAAVLGPVSCFFTLLVGAILGAVSGLFCIAAKKKKMQSPIPFGVCLAIGTYLWLMCGFEAVRAYLRFAAKIGQ